MNILIIDDSALWIKQGEVLLGKVGHNVTGLVVSDPKPFTSAVLPEVVVEALKGIDVLVIDKDFSGGITSTRLICVIRHNYPKLPIIRWTGGYDRSPYIGYLGVSNIEKPTRRNEAEFTKVFESSLNEQKLILSGAMGIFTAFNEATKTDDESGEAKANRLKQLAQIAQLANKDRVDSGNWEYPWTITGRSGGVTKHEFGHCICDGLLTAEEIRPFLSDLQKVIAKFESAGEIDDRFKICAEFIKSGKLDELELVKRCY